MSGEQAGGSGMPDESTSGEAAAELPEAVVAALRSGEVDVASLVHRLQDRHLLDNPDLHESLAQIRRGEFTVVRSSDSQQR